MKKIIISSWNSRFLGFAMLSYSTKIHHLARMGPHHMDTLIYYQLIAAPSLKSGSKNLKKLKNKPSKPCNHQKPFRTHMPTHFLTLILVHMWPSRIPNPSSGIFMASLLTSVHIAETMSRLRPQDVRDGSDCLRSALYIKLKN